MRRQQLSAMSVRRQRNLNRLVRSLIVAPLMLAVLGGLFFGHAANPASWLGYGQVGLIVSTAYVTAGAFLIRRQYYGAKRAELRAKGQDPAGTLAIIGVNLFLSVSCFSFVLCLFGLPLWQHYIACALSFGGMVAWPIWLERRPPPAV